MFRLHSQLRAVAVGVVAALAGCQFPGFDRPDTARAGSARSPLADASAAEPRTIPEPVNPPAVADFGNTAPSAADEATMAAVMKDVEEIGRTNPEARDVLLAELRRSKPSMWPAIVTQFRATLAFHDHLMSKSAPAAEPASDISNQLSAKPSPAPPAAVAGTDPPSAEFGKLADPRRARPDPAIEKLFANSTPANMPAPVDQEVIAQAFSAPRALEHDTTAQAINPRAANRDRPFVQPASSDTMAAANRVEPALYSVESAPEKLDWQKHLALAIEDLKQEVADGPQSTAEVHQLVSLRLLQLLAGRTEQALEPIPKITPEEQDYWSSQVFALATFLDHHTQPDDKRRAAAGVIHLDEAVGHLRELGALSLRNLAFCEKVHGYGSYDEIERPKFAAGDQVTLYVEIENYHSESTADGYETLLGASYEILNDDGNRVDGGEFPVVEDCCRSRRRDFHIQYGLAMPKTLTTGNYKLQLVMNDRQSDKRGHATIDFAISGP